MPSFLRFLTFSKRALIPLAWKPAYEAYNEAACDPLGLFVNFLQLSPVASMMKIRVCLLVCVLAQFSGTPSPGIMTSSLNSCCERNPEYHPVMLHLPHDVPAVRLHYSNYLLLVRLSAKVDFVSSENEMLLRA